MIEGVLCPQVLAICINITVTFKIFNSVNSTSRLVPLLRVKRRVTNIEDFRRFMLPYVTPLTDNTNVRGRRRLTPTRHRHMFMIMIFVSCRITPYTPTFEVVFCCVNFILRHYFLSDCTYYVVHVYKEVRLFFFIIADNRNGTRRDGNRGNTGDPGLFRGGFFCCWGLYGCALCVRILR